MKKLLTSLAVAALALTASADTVKIGIILPLTGNNALFGQMVMPAVKLFQNELNSTQTLHNYKLIIEDDQMTPRLTAQVMQKLISLDKVDAIISSSSGSGNVVAPIAERLGIPHICMATDISIGAKHSHSFVHWIRPESETKAYVQLLTKLGKHKISIIAMRQQGAEAWVNALRPDLAQAKIDADIVYFNPGERDFRPILARIQEKKTDAIVPFAFSPELEIILRQTKQLGIKASSPDMEVYDFITDMTLAEGQYYVSASRGTPEFLAKLKAVTGSDACYGTAFTYNALEFIKDAYEANPKIDHQLATDYLTSLKERPSAVGLVSTASDHLIDSAPIYFQILHGQIIPVTLDQIH